MILPIYLQYLCVWVRDVERRGKGEKKGIRLSSYIKREGIIIIYHSTAHHHSTAYFSSWGENKRKKWELFYLLYLWGLVCLVVLLYAYACE